MATQKLTIYYHSYNYWQREHRKSGDQVLGVAYDSTPVLAFGIVESEQTCGALFMCSNGLRYPGIDENGVSYLTSNVSMKHEGLYWRTMVQKDE